VLIKAIAGAAAAVVLLAGCGSVGGRADAADVVAQRLFTALDADDGAAACALLAPVAAAAVSDAGEEPCAEAILEEELPAAGEVTETSVYGQWAQVRLTGDTVFLASFQGGWRVMAAGCTAQPGGRPYRCVIEGA
jgi:hypothetical protein